MTQFDDAVEAYTALALINAQIVVWTARPASARRTAALASLATQKTTAQTLLTAAQAAAQAVVGASAGGLIAYLSEVQPSTTNGGTASAGTIVARTLNTISDPSSIVTALAANKFTLPAGTYRFYIRAPGYLIGRTKAVLYDVTNGAIALNGAAAYSGGPVQVDAIVQGVLTITAPTQYRVDHYITDTEATNGLGVASNIAGVSEVFTQVTIEKLS